MPAVDRKIRWMHKLRTDLKIFAKISRTPKGVLVFISNYGPFTHAGIAGGGDQVLTIINQAEEMTKRLNLLSAGSRLGAEIPITSLRGFLVTDRATGGIALKIVPATLRDALWLQLAQALSDGARMRKCRHCDEWFRAGAGTDRRADADSVLTNTESGPTVSREAGKVSHAASRHH